jgi:hypothetical protein
MHIDQVMDCLMAPTLIIALKLKITEVKNVRFLVYTQASINLSIYYMPIDKRKTIDRLT